VASKVDSRTVLDGNGAEQLLGRGDMIFVPPGASRQMRVHGSWVADNEVKAICDFLRKQGSAVYEKVELPAMSEEGGRDGEDRDDIYWDAVNLVIAQRAASISFLQRRLGLGYPRRRVHRHDGAGPHHRPRAGGEASRDPRRARIPLEAGQVMRPENPSPLRRGLRSVRRLAALIVVSVLLLPAPAPAQELEQVVSGLEGTYAKIIDLKAEFSQVAKNKSLGQDVKAEGTVYLKKGGKMRWEYKSPRSADRLGRHVSVGLHAGAQPGEPGRGAQGPRGPAGSFLQGLGKVREEFSVRFLNPATKVDSAGRPCSTSPPSIRRRS